jgi:hypothetical protein
MNVCLLALSCHQLMFVARYPLCQALLSTHEQLEVALHPFLNDMSALYAQLAGLRQQVEDAETNTAIRLDVIENNALTATNQLITLNHSIMAAMYVTSDGGTNTSTPNSYGSFVYTVIFSVLFMGVMYVFISWFQTAIFKNRFCASKYK